MKKTKKKPIPNAAYKLLRQLGMRTAMARHFLVLLRMNGFVVVKEAEITKVKDINQKLEILIALMKRQPRRRK